MLTPDTAVAVALYAVAATSCASIALVAFRTLADARIDRAFAAFERRRRYR